MAGETKDTRALKLAVGLYLVVFVLKIIVYLLTGVIAVLAEALHTLSDMFVSVFLLVAVVYSRRRADDVHMFGYGRAQNVAALVAAVLFISFTSYKLFEESIPRLFETSSVEYRNVEVAVAVLLISMVIAAAPLLNLMRQKEKGPAAKAQLRELFNDELGLIAALVGTISILEGEPIGDPIAAIIVATIIAYSAAGLFLENMSFLVGRSPGPQFKAHVVKAASSVAGVRGVHGFKAEYVGPEAVHADFHIEVARGTPIEEVDKIVKEVEARVKKETECGDCIVHVDPADSPIEDYLQTGE